MQTVDRDRVIGATTDYVESWLDGDAERMASCLHPSLAKRTVADPDSEALDLQEAPFAAMTTTAVVERKPFGREFDISTLDLTDGIASVRAVSEPFVDLLHLARFGDRWLIVNALYEDRPRADAPGDAAGVERALDDYAASWFDREPARARRAVHPALAERRVLDPSAGTLDLLETTFEELLEIVAEGPDEPVERRWEAEAFGVHGDIATARVAAAWFDIFLHLARFGDAWMVVNILYRTKDEW